MPPETELYDRHYGSLTADPQVEVRRQTWGEDLGQASWITLAEARRILFSPQPAQAPSPETSAS